MDNTENNQKRKLHTSLDETITNKKHHNDTEFLSKEISAESTHNEEPNLSQEADRIIETKLSECSMDKDLTNNNNVDTIFSNMEKFVKCSLPPEERIKTLENELKIKDDKVARLLNSNNKLSRRVRHTVMVLEEVIILVCVLH